MNKWNRSLETDLCIYKDLISDKVIPAELWEKEKAVFSIHGLRKIGSPHRNKKNKLDK